MCQEGKVPISSMFVSPSLCCVGRDSRCNSKRHLHTCDCDVLSLRLRNCILSFHVTWARQVNMVGHVTFGLFFTGEKGPLCQDHLWAFTLFCDLPKFSQTWAHRCQVRELQQYSPAREEVFPTRARMCTMPFVLLFAPLMHGRGRNYTYDHEHTISFIYNI